MSVLSEEKRVDEPQASSGNEIRDTAAQREANETQLLLAGIVESSDDAILSIRLDGTIISWNRGPYISSVTAKKESSAITSAWSFRKN
jgi:PAS domain-containing protein